GFRYYFIPLTGVLFTFPSRYLFTIGRERVFSLGRWSSQLPAGFHVSRGTRELLPERPARFVYGTVTPFGCPFQDHSTTRRFSDSPGKPRSSPTTPEVFLPLV